MPIYNLLKGFAFEPEHLQVIGDAFEAALVALKIERTSPVAEILAMKIIELAQRGERDPKRLRDYGVEALTPKPPKTTG